MKQLLVTPMQRLTRYSLLLSAIAKMTEEKNNLDKIVRICTRELNADNKAVSYRSYV